ncbi:MAG: DUF1109 family protein [Acidobacteriaceae bacterium]|nr:DUF1109 family protein [Acidobacteriaceae bacterium]
MSAGRPLTEAAKDHLLSCTGCTAMLEALKAPEPQVDDGRIHQIERLITTSLTPVHPLPSDRTLIWALVALFIAFAMMGGIPVDYRGFHVLNAYQSVAYYTVVLLCAVWFSAATVQLMIPGSKRRTNPPWVIAVSMILLVLLSAALFRNFDLTLFVSRGVGCLRLGSIYTLASGVLLWSFLRKGFASSPVQTGATAGFFAGLLGVAVLALRCPIENSAHMIVWHLGAMVLGGLGGAIVGILKQGLWRKQRSE